MKDYSNLINGLDSESKSELRSGWSFCKIEDQIKIIRRAFIEDDVEFDRFITINDIKYFVFRFRAPQQGILATARNAFVACEWASRHGLIPYIDFEWGYYFENNFLAKDNFFDYVFEQNVTIDDIWNSNFICGDINWEYSHDERIRKDLFGNTKDVRVNCVSDGYRSYYENIKKYCDKWIRLLPEIKQLESIAQIHSSEQRILGLAVREGFSQKDCLLSKNNMFLYHPKEPTIYECAKDVEEILSKYECDYLFVTAQTIDTIAYLREMWGDKLLFVPRTRPKQDEYYLASRRFMEENLDRNSYKYFEFCNSGSREAEIINTFTKERMKDYVREIVSLSACDVFVGGKAGGSIMACVWNGGKYEDVIFWNDEHNSALY